MGCWWDAGRNSVASAPAAGGHSAWYRVHETPIKERARYDAEPGKGHNVTPENLYKDCGRQSVVPYHERCQDCLVRIARPKP